MKGPMPPDTEAPRTATIDGSGTYAVHGLVPGAYPVVVTTKGRKVSDPVGVVVRAGGPSVDLQPGPRPAVFKGWFIASGAGVPTVTGRAVDGDGDVVTFAPTSNGEVRQEFSIVLTARPVSGEPTPSSESSEVRWVPVSEVRDYTMDRSMRIRINDYLAHNESPVVI